MGDDLTIDIDLAEYSELGTDGYLGVAAGNSAIAAVGPGPGPPPGNSAIAAVGPGPRGDSSARGISVQAATPLVSWSHIAPAQD